DLEENILSNLDFEVSFYYRYVDDCIAAVPADKVNIILNKFNDYHKNLQFTSEIEINNKINFLDVTLHHIDESIKTEWYTKKTWSSRYLNFDSSHPIAQRKSVIIGLADCAIQLSDPEYRKNAIKKAKDALVLNNYPKKLINKLFKNRIHKFYNSIKNNKNQQNKTTKYLSLPENEQFL
ncbi:MAG: hypothetical protein KTM48_00870, partial [Wolbachia endosymbiont of Pissodes strobi]|nr:hypothetical protein [Wolbachia endosymbiont of Pissodes strobi]